MEVSAKGTRGWGETLGPKTVSEKDHGLLKPPTSDLLSHLSLYLASARG